MSYIPEQGDIILLDFDPQAGHEQGGKRPAFVVSNYTFNKFTKMAMVCPVTNTNRRFPLHIELDEQMKTKGFVLCEQVKSLDIIARNSTFLERTSKEIVDEIVMLVKEFI